MGPVLLQAGRSDLHVHTSLSPDAAKDCTLDNLAAVAAGLGLREIGLADHLSGWEVDYYDGGGYSCCPEEHLPLLD